MFKNFIITTKEASQQFNIKQSVISYFMSKMQGTEKLSNAFYAPRETFVNFINELIELMEKYNINKERKNEK